MQLDLFKEPTPETEHEEVYMKTCVGCGEEKPITEYNRLVRRHGDRHTYYPTCKTCNSKGAVAKAEWKKNNPLPEDHACPICGKTHEDYLKLGKYRDQSPFSIDHCYKTLKVRGYICNPCNSALGLAKHDKTVLKNMIKYLEDE